MYTKKKTICTFTGVMNMNKCTNEQQIKARKKKTIVPAK